MSRFLKVKVGGERLWYKIKYPLASGGYHCELNSTPVVEEDVPAEMDIVDDMVIERFDRAIDGPLHGEEAE